VRERERERGVGVEGQREREKENPKQVPYPVWSLTMWDLMWGSISWP